MFECDFSLISMPSRAAVGLRHHILKHIFEKACIFQNVIIQLNTKREPTAIRSWFDETPLGLLK